MNGRPASRRAQGTGTKASGRARWTWRPAGMPQPSGQQSGCGLGLQTCGPPQGPLCLGEARAGPLAGPGAAEATAQGGSRGAGRAAHLPAGLSGPHRGSPPLRLPGRAAPSASPLDFGWTRPNAEPAAAAMAGPLASDPRPDPTPQSCRGMRGSGGLPPGRPDPTPGRASGRRHRGPRPGETRGRAGRHFT